MIGRKYSEDDTCTIHGFLAHFENEYFGHSAANDCYESNMQRDPRGICLAEAKRGSVFFRKLHDLEAKYPDLIPSCSNSPRRKS